MGHTSQSHRMAMAGPKETMWGPQIPNSQMDPIWTTRGLVKFWGPIWALGPLGQSQVWKYEGTWAHLGSIFWILCWGPSWILFGAQSGAHMGALMWGDVMSHITWSPCPFPFCELEPLKLDPSMMSAR